MKTKMIGLSFLMMFALLIGFASIVKAQSCPDPNNTTLSGRITLKRGIRGQINPAPGQLVQAVGPNGTGGLTIADDGGYYKITDLAPCTYHFVQVFPYPYNFGYSDPDSYFWSTGDGDPGTLDFLLYP